MNAYFHPREGLHTLKRDLHTRSCKIAFLGNSITAQKEGYAYQLANQIKTYFSPTHEFIFAGLGGMGSLASCFMMEDFVLRHKPDICFVECTVADIGYATPNHYLKPSIEGIIQKLISSSTKICFLHLYNTHTLPERADEIISLYEEVIDSYKIPSINVREKINSFILTDSYKTTDILYDGVHTTNQGALIYVDVIMHALISMLNVDSGLTSQRSTSLESPFRFTQIVLPESLLQETSLHLKKSRFRGLIKYIHMNSAYTFETSLEDGMIVGFFIVADDTSGVLHVSYGDNSLAVQTYDQWCIKERIQAVILEKPVLSSQKLCISLSTLDKAPRGANGTANNFKKIGSSFKLIGLMTSYDHEPKLKLLLW